MKTQLLAILAGVCFSTSSFALDQTKADQFRAGLEAALKAQDTAALDRFYYTTGADSARITLPSASFEIKEAFADNVFDSVQVIPLDDPSLPASEVLFCTEGVTQNGRHYVSNLQPVAFCKIVFKPGKKRGTYILTSPIGIDPAGDLKFVQEKYAGGSPIFSVGLTDLDRFKAAVEAALEARNLNAFGSLFFVKGVSQSQMDGEIAAFERGQAADIFDSVQVQSFDEPLPDGIQANPGFFKPPTDGKPTAGGGFPNLKPMMLCIINFKTKEGKPGNHYFRWVGIDPKGNHKFTMNIDKRNATPQP